MGAVEFVASSRRFNAIQLNHCMKLPLLTRFAFSAALAALLCSFSHSAHADYASTVMGLNPIVYYHLSETGPEVPADVVTNRGTLGASANGYTISGGSPGWAENFTPGAIAGSSDACMSFSRLGVYPDGVSIPYTAGVNPPAPCTMECWANPPGTTGGDLWSPFGCIDAGAGRSGFLFYQANSGNTNGPDWQFRLGDINLYVAQPKGGIETDNTWHHLVGVIDGVNAILYVNGVEVARSGLSRPYAPNPGETLDIGFSSSFDRRFVGLIDECAIYTNVLTPAEILSHYQTATNPSPSMPYDQLVLSKNPIGYWRLDQPVFTPPDPSTYPVAVNSGTLGAAANGTYQPGTALGMPGVPFPGFSPSAKSAKFNGINANVQIPPLTGLSTNVFTFAAWILSQAPQQGNAGYAGYAGLMWQRDSSDNISSPMGLDYWADGFQLHTMWWEGATNGDYGLLPAVPLQPQVYVWSFVGAVWTPTNTTIYLNDQHAIVPGAGDPAASNGPHTAHDFSIGPITLGRDLAVGNWAFNGLMAEPALFAQALSTAQMLSLYNAAQPTPQVATLTQNPPGPNYEGQTITLTVTAQGPSPFTYQWQKTSSPLSGQTTSVLTLANVTANDSGSYTVVLGNANGSSTSAPVVLNIAAVAPQLVTQPKAATRYAGFPATFSVLALGSTPITYLWAFNDNPILGATNSSYTVPSTGSGTIGNYSVQITNPHGVTNSAHAALTSLPVPPGYPAAVLAAGPAAYWRFNETNGLTAFDYAGGHDGSYPAALTNGVPGPDPSIFPGLEAKNTSYAFDGSLAVILAPPIPDGSNYISAVALVNNGGASSAQKDYACFIATREIGDIAYFCVRSSGDLAYDWNDDPISYNFPSGFTTPPGTWAFVAETVSSNQAVLYMDSLSGAGMQAITNVLAAPPLPLKAAINIGGDLNVNIGQDRSWQGGMDEVAYYTRPLSFDEINAIHTALLTVPVTPPTLTFSVSGGNLVLNFDKGVLQSAVDVTSTFTNVPGSAPPSFSAPMTGSRAFFRVKN
jgi:hypothetical protein